MINNTSAIFMLRATKIIGHDLFSLQIDDEPICFGFQTFFMTTGFVGLTSTSCPIVSYLRKRCSLRFWV